MDLCSLFKSISFNIPDQIYKDIDIIAFNYLQIISHNYQEIPLNYLYLNEVNYSDEEKRKIIFFLKENGVSLLYKSISSDVYDAQLAQGLFDFYLESF